MDEGAHEANFSDIVHIYLKYMPDVALDALMKVSTRYRMPDVHVPNSEQFIEALVAAGMGIPRDIINLIINPALARLGLESRPALRHAVKNLQDLPEGVAVQLPGKPMRDLPEDVASAIYEMRPAGDFALAMQDEGAGT